MRFLATLGMTKKNRLIIKRFVEHRRIELLTF